MKKKPIKIKEIRQLEQLVRESKEQGLECFILLRGGLRSSKTIHLIEIENQILYEIYNHIDDTEEILSLQEFNSSFIGEALGSGNLYKY